MKLKLGQSAALEMAFRMVSDLQSFGEVKFRTNFQNPWTIISLWCFTRKVPILGSYKTPSHTHAPPEYLARVGDGSSDELRGVQL